MSNKEKLEALKAFLKENGIHFREKVILKGQKADLFIGKYQICVRLSDENDQRFYEVIKHIYHPLFIRDKETKEFVIEKMQNLIIDIMKKQQNRFLKKKDNAKDTHR